MKKKSLCDLNKLAAYILDEATGESTENETVKIEKNPAAVYLGRLGGLRGGSVNSLYFVIVYLFFSIPTIVLGFVATHLGLYGAIFTFSGIVTVLILAEMVWLTIRQRSANIGHGSGKFDVF
jgi:hypothetical protein